MTVRAVSSTVPRTFTVLPIDQSTTPFGIALVGDCIAVPTDDGKVVPASFAKTTDGGLFGSGASTTICTTNTEPLDTGDDFINKYTQITNIKISFDSNLSLFIHARIDLTF
jgi:hypothetical protein